MLVFVPALPVLYCCVCNRVKAADNSRNCPERSIFLLTGDTARRQMIRLMGTLILGCALLSLASSPQGSHLTRGKQWLGYWQLWANENEDVTWWDDNTPGRA